MNTTQSSIRFEKTDNLFQYVTFSCTKLFQRFLQKILIVAFCLVAATVMASPGDLDTQYDADGKVTYNIFAMNDHINEMAIQPDGKVVAVGRSFLGPDTFGSIIRIKTDGVNDSSFNGGGVILNNAAFAFEAVAIQPDGKIIAGGIASGYNNFVLFRYDSTGGPDNDFGTNGKVTTDFSTAEEIVRKVAVQKDGKIVAVGDGSNEAFLISRYLSNGTPDPDFGIGGKLSIFLPQATETFVAGMVIQPSGKIVIAGTASYNGGESVFALVRVNSNGTPDNTFTTLTNSHFYNKGELVFDIAENYSNGKMTVLGTCEDNSAIDHICMVNFTEEGTYLQANNATPTLDMAGRALALRPDGKIVVAGRSGNYLGILQYTDNLGLDTSFGINGIKTVDFTGTGEEANGVAIQGDGKIVVGGGVSNADPDLAFARVKGFDGPLLADDFNGASPFWNVLSGNWTVSGGALKGGPTKGKVFAPLPWSPSNQSSCTQCSVLFSFSTTAGATSNISAYAWYTSSKNCVQLVIKPSNGKLILKQKSDGYLRKSAVKMNIVPGAIYNVAMVQDGDNIILTINGVPQVQQPLYTPFTGNVGFKVSNTSLAVNEFYIY